MFLGGLWHGASYNFITWGSLHGGYLIVQKLWSKLTTAVAIRTGWTMPRGARWFTIGLKVALVYGLTLLAWVFFRIKSFSDAMVFLAGIARLHELGVIFNRFSALKAMGLILAVVAIDLVFIHRRNVVRLLHTRFAYALAIALLLVMVELFGSFGGGAFIYFQF